MGRVEACLSGQRAAALQPVGSVTAGAAQGSTAFPLSPLVTPPSPRLSPLPGARGSATLPQEELGKLLVLLFNPAMDSLS